MKRKKRIIGNFDDAVLSSAEVKKCELIGIISGQSDRFGDKLLDFMDEYHLANLQQATLGQLESFVKVHCSRARQQISHREM